MPKKRLIKVKKTRHKKKICAPAEEFVFRLPEGREVGRARDIDELVSRLKTVPVQSVLYHGKNGHFSGWLEFVGEKGAAKRISTAKGDGEEYRKDLIKRI